MNEILDAEVRRFLDEAESGRPVDVAEFSARTPSELGPELKKACSDLVLLGRLFKQLPPAPPRELAMGDVVGDFQITRMIDRGGMGIVYEARQSSLDRLVALKTIHSQGAADARALRRFRRECLVLAAIDHPNVVRVLSAGEAFGNRFFTMELIEGRTLRQHLDGLESGARESDAPPRYSFRESKGTREGGFADAARLVADIAFAVGHAHLLGIYHRDLKPENVVIDKAGRPKLIDFGLAKFPKIPTLATHAGNAGTLEYQPPELHSTGWATDVVIDLWALGTILAEVIGLQHPFHSADKSIDLVALRSGRRTAPSQTYIKAPRALRAICDMCLERDPLLRYRTAQGFEVDLRRFLAGEPPLLSGRTPLLRVRTVLVRHRVWIAAATVSAAAIVSVLFTATLLLRRSEHTGRLAARMATLNSINSDPHPPTDSRLVVARSDALAIEDDPDATLDQKEVARRMRFIVAGRAEKLLSDAGERLHRSATAAVPSSLDEIRPRQDALLFDGITRLKTAELLGAAVDLTSELSKVFPKLSVLRPDDTSDATIEVAPNNLSTGEVDSLLTIIAPLPLRMYALGPGYYRITIRSGSSRVLGEFDRYLVDPIEYSVAGTSPTGRNDTSQMSQVPPGTYPVGFGEPPAVDGRSPYRAQEVRVAGFWIDKYEVTCRDYLAFCKDNQTLFPSDWREHGIPTSPKELSLPVRGISWLAATRYAEARGCRLPTWVEWQIAARGRRGSLYPWGNDFRDLTQAAAIGHGPYPPGSFPKDRSEFDVYDMLGNVAEWTSTPFVTLVEGSLFPNFGSRIVAGLDWLDDLDKDPKARASTTLVSVSPGAPASRRFGFRCARSLK